MSNPIFEAFGRQMQGMPQGMNPGQFVQMAKNWGQGLQGNPEQIVKMMMQSGRISQEQFKAADQMVRNIIK